MRRGLQRNFLVFKLIHIVSITYDDKKISDVQTTCVFLYLPSLKGIMILLTIIGEVN